MFETLDPTDSETTRPIELKNACRVVLPKAGSEWQVHHDCTYNPSI